MKPSAETAGGEPLTCWQVIVHRLGKTDTTFNAKRLSEYVGHLIIHGKSAMFFTLARFLNSCLTLFPTGLTSQGVSATRLVPQ